MVKLFQKQKAVAQIYALCLRCRSIDPKYFGNHYVGHPISSDNGLIPQKLLLKSEFYYPLHVAMGVAYSYLKYGSFITFLSDAIQI